jgi:hypothetical protein
MVHVWEDIVDQAKRKRSHRCSRPTKRASTRRSKGPQTSAALLIQTEAVYGCDCQSCMWAPVQAGGIDGA